MNLHIFLGIYLSVMQANPGECYNYNYVNPGVNQFKQPTAIRVTQPPRRHSWWEVVDTFVNRLESFRRTPIEMDSLRRRHLEKLDKLKNRRIWIMNKRQKQIDQLKAKLAAKRSGHKNKQLPQNRKNNMTKTNNRVHVMGERVNQNNQRFNQNNQQFNHNNQQFNQNNQRFNQNNQRVNQNNQRLNQNNQRFDQNNQRLNQNNQRFNQNSQRFNQNNQRLNQNIQQFNQNNQRFSQNNQRVNQNNPRFTQNNQRLTQNR